MIAASLTSSLAREAFTASKICFLDRPYTKANSQLPTTPYMHAATEPPTHLEVCVSSNRDRITVHSKKELGEDHNVLSGDFEVVER
jgi:hypothetical protein